MSGADLRAGAIALVIFVNFLVALPLPKSVKRSTFDQPVAREELASLAALVGRVTATPTHDELADFLYESAKPLVGLRTFLTAPLKEPFRVLGTGQAWGLFTYPDTFPHRLVVEGRSDGWERLYAGLDPDHAFLRDVLVYRRVRGVYDGNTTKPGDSWENLSRWLADRVFEARPDVVAVKVYFERFHTVPPGGKVDPEVVVRHLRHFSRGFREAQEAAGAAP